MGTPKKPEAPAAPMPPEPEIESDAAAEKDPEAETMTATELADTDHPKAPEKPLETPDAPPAE